MEQSNIGFCHFEPSLAGFVNEMECQVSGDTSQRPSNIAGNSGGLAQQTLNTIFENSEFSNENHFDHHHHHPNFPVTSTQFFMSGEMFGMSSSSNSSVFNFPAPSFLSQADLSRVYPFIQRGTAMQGLLSSTMDPHHHHHHHHHPHLPHQLTHSIFPMHRFPDLLNANPEVLPTLNFHSDIRGSAPFFKPAMQFSVHQQQQNILKLPTLPSTCAPNVIPNSPTPSTSSSAQPTSSLQNVMPPKPVEVSPPSSTPSGGNCDQGIIKHSMNSNLIPTQRHDIHRNMEDNGASGNMSSPILKFSEGSKIFPGDFLAFQKAHQSNSSDHLSNHNRMSLISPNAVEANKMNNLHFQPRALDSGMASTAPSEDDGVKSRKSNKSNKQKHQRANNNSNNNGCNNSVMNESCMNQMLAVQVSTGGAEIKSQVDFDEGDKNVDIVNTILQLVNDDKAEEIDQPEHLSGISTGRDGDGTKDVEFFDGRLQDSNSNSASQQQLHSMIPQHQSVSIKVDSLVQVEESQCIMVDNQKRWKCSQCPKMYSTKHNLITHMLGHKGIKPHFCSLCGKYFKQVSHLHTHMLTHGKIKPHTCPVCFRSFTQSCHVKRHMVIHQQDKTHACNICGRNFAYPNDLKKHLQKHEEGECMLEPETPKRTDDGDDDDNETRRTPASSKRQILKLHAIQNGLKCDQCPLSFESKDKLLNHRALEHRDTYACAECDKVFAYPSQLKHHASKHNNIRPFICRECGENFMKEHHLKAHMFTHTGLKPYDCTTCGRAFNQKANLRRHTLIHEAQKKFACDVCGKMFTQLQILRAHLITHREQKPFQCKICDKRFSRLHNLNGHMHLHGGERPYVCSCGSSFTLKGNLNRHKKDKNCQPIEMIELDEIDTKPIFDAIAVDTVNMETDKGAGSSGDDRRDGADGLKKKRKSVPRKSVARDAGGDSENKKEEENDSSTWQEKREDDDYEDEDGSGDEEEIKTERQPNDYIELLTVKEYLFDKADDNEGDKFSSSNFPFQGVMYNHEPSADQSMQFLSFASESTNCSAANRDESDRADDSADKDLSTTDDEYDYDESSLMAEEKPRLNLS